MPATAGPAAAEAALDGNAATVVQPRGIGGGRETLAAEHRTPAEIASVMSHVTVETAGGASLGMPAGVRSVNYIDGRDSIANVFGQGEPTLKDIAVLDAAAGATRVPGACRRSR